MDRTILQVPMSKTLKKQAEIVAKSEGFSSLQEIIRILVNKYRNKEIRVTITQKEEAVKLSPGAIKRYNKIIDEIEKGKGVTKTKNVDELLELLHK